LLQQRVEHTHTAGFDYHVGIPGIGQRGAHTGVVVGWIDHTARICRCGNILPVKGIRLITRSEKGDS
jgi:hypothetical protein